MSVVVDTTQTGRRIAYVAVALAAGWSICLWALRFFGAERPIHEAEWWIGDAALASVYALPACIGVVALRGRTYLLRTAGVVSLVLSISLVVSIAAFPLVVPGVLFLIAANRADPASTHDTRALVIGVVTIVAAAGALSALIASSGHVVCWRETQYADGRTVIARDATSERRSTSGSITMSGGPPRGDVVSEGGGCTDGAFPPSRSLLALGSVAAATLVTWRFG
jgi:hypothetical protein